MAPWGRAFTSVVKKLGEEGCIYHMHGKDILLEHDNGAVNGLLNVTPYEDIVHLSRSYPDIGFSHDLVVWKSVVEELMAVGYDYVISIEHESPFTSARIGVARGAQALQQALQPRPDSVRPKRARMLFSLVISSSIMGGKEKRPMEKTNSQYTQPERLIPGVVDEIQATEEGLSLDERLILRMREVGVSYKAIAERLFGGRVSRKRFAKRRRSSNRRLTG